MHLLLGQKRLDDEYNYLDMLFKVNKADMAGMMKSIKEYLRSSHGVVRASLAYIIRKTITVQTYGDYPTYAAPDDKMIARILQLCRVIKSSYNRVEDRQQKCLCHPGSDLQGH